MKIVEINRHPAEKILRWFAFFWTPLAFVVLALMQLFKHGPGVVSSVLFVAAVIAPLIMLCVPPTRRWFWIGWMTITFPIAFVVTHTVLIVLWCVVITPLSVALRLTGFDPMKKKFDASRKSYWEVYPKSGPAERFFRQF